MCLSFNGHRAFFLQDWPDFGATGKPYWGSCALGWIPRGRGRRDRSFVEDNVLRARVLVLRPLAVRGVGDMDAQEAVVLRVVVGWGGSRLRCGHAVPGVAVYLVGEMSR